MAYRKNVGRMDLASISANVIPMKIIVIASNNSPSRLVCLLAFFAAFFSLSFEVARSIHAHDHFNQLNLDDDDVFSNHKMQIYLELRRKNLFLLSISNTEWNHKRITKRWNVQNIKLKAKVSYWHNQFLSSWCDLLNRHIFFLCSFTIY